MSKEDLGVKNRKRLLENQIQNILYEEQKVLIVKSNIATEKLRQQIDRHVPNKGKDMFNSVFAKGFEKVFSDGIGIIEKSYNKSSHQREFSESEKMLGVLPTRKTLDKIRNKSKLSAIKNNIISATEGGVLGLFGIAIPDIPIFIALILKNIYEIALKYGFDYVSDVEKRYILSIIELSSCSENECLKLSQQTDDFAMLADVSNCDTLPEFKVMIDNASKQLSQYIVLTKMIQGLPIVGALSAITNYSFMDRIGKVAEIKYHKRFLERSLREVKRQIVNKGGNICL